VAEAKKTDEELMAEFQQGNLLAFETLYARYKSPIFGFLCRLCANRDLAEELHQETFLRLVRGKDSYHFGAKFATWLYSIARNQVVDAKRREKYRRHASLDQPAQEDGAALRDRIADTGPTPDRESIAKKLQGDLEKALAALPEDQREVFCLREYSGLKFQEIAEVTGAKEGTVKSRMRYALEALQASLSRYGDYARTLT
jgi:RNA polymerase sigma-70 factor (ECF subfamily)